MLALPKEHLQLVMVSLSPSFAMTDLDAHQDTGTWASSAGMGPESQRRPGNGLFLVAIAQDRVRARRVHQASPCDRQWAELGLASLNHGLTPAGGHNRAK